MSYFINAPFERASVLTKEAVDGTIIVIFLLPREEFTETWRGMMNCSMTLSWWWAGVWCLVSTAVVVNTS